MNDKRQNEPKPTGLDILLRLGGFAVVAFFVLIAASGSMPQLDTVTRSTLSVFAAGVVANLLLTLKFEHGRLSDVGLSWEPSVLRNLASGLALGAGSVLLLVLGAVLSGLAQFESAGIEKSALWIAVLLLVGVFGEELVFRGYPFQYMVRKWNQPVTVVGSSLLVGLAHLSNHNVQFLGAANTALWGGLLGYAYARTRSLWLPAGLHFGWNIALALCTSNMSGITIRATAWSLHWSAGELWSGGAYGLEGGLLATFAALPVFLFVRRMR